MKGLLIKDLRLLLAQKKFLVFVIGFSFFFLFVNKNFEFAVGYMSMLFVMFTCNTISYDELDNGMSYLLTLPVTRKKYAKEKYLFGFIMLLVSCVIAVAFSVVGALTNTIEINALHMLMSCGIIIVVACVFTALMIPLQIKFGAEKSRVVIFVVALAISAIVALVGKLLEQLGINIDSWFGEFALQPKPLIVAELCMVVLVIMGISYLCTVRFMQKKEF